MNASADSAEPMYASPDGASAVPPDAGASGDAAADAEGYHRPAHIIFIAGSAGSLKALQRLFGALSPDVDAAVLITIHLPPDHHTLLPEILARVTPMRLSIARAGDVLERGHVYVAPPGYHHVMLKNGRVHLRPQPAHARRGVSADPLFVSGAHDFGAAAIGVVLSGANTNGAAGVRAIRAAGGRAAAQRPSDAAFGVMPQAALNAGVDYCGSAEDIGRYLSAICAPRP
jgi:two-component system chemotaxis response regulator CheB